MDHSDPVPVGTSSWEPPPAGGGPGSPSALLGTVPGTTVLRVPGHSKTNQSGFEVHKLARTSSRTYLEQLGLVLVRLVWNRFFSIPVLPSTRSTAPGPERSKVRRNHTPYGRYSSAGGYACPAKLAWFLQEVPAFLVPLVLLLLSPESGSGSGSWSWSWSWPRLSLFAFMLHYFHRSVIFAALTRGRPVPLPIVLYAAIFCSLNGFLQGHHLLHCTSAEATGPPGARAAAGFLLFLVGMGINIHSDHVLRSLRRPGEVAYRIPRGGVFELVSGANFLGEILEWAGYALATWSLPALAFAFFTACSIGPRAYHHHRDYQRRFEDYPRSRAAIIPFLL